MIITADERRSVLKLFNVSEAARHLGMPVRKMHWEISSGRLPALQIQLGKRAYYTAADLPVLAEQYAEIPNRP